MQNKYLAAAAVLAFAAVGCGDASFFSNDGETTASSSTSNADDSDDDDTFDPEMEVPTRVPSVPAETDDPDVSNLAPIDVRAPEKYLRVVENVIDYRVPETVYVYVHDGGGRRVDLSGLDPGETTSFMPAPKESPSLFVERMKDRIRERLVDAGYETDRAESIVDRRADELFRENGRRVIYIAPASWTESSDAQPLGAVPTSLE